ncbi:hypothetical protein Taro_019806 [Colocasia esculenta]|uniref:Protein kinase domain-containing protein n=1 Tax=Colocasia esculenta TaxID=4460 RepID=A0A843V089_COLES|nr:hypothetical protein [Colocasia esculenta]
MASILATAGSVFSVLSLALDLVLLFSIDSIPFTTRLAFLSCVTLLTLVGVIWFFCQRCRRQRTAITAGEIRDVEMGSRGAEIAASPVDDDGVGPTRFPYAELMRATNNFDTRRKLGQGGFGAVYRGVLRDIEVAIKMIVREGDGEKSFKAEVKTIGQLNQKNLVRLLGWCRAGSLFFVVYEYMPNRSLDRHLFWSPPADVDESGLLPTLLPWEKRYTIVLGLASALKYLHEDLRECVVHRDIKAANIMLDADFKARLGDFGLARTVAHGYSVATSQNAGTVGYMAPELHRGRGPSKESDVYSFGVVALEVACGKKASSQPEQEEEKLVAWVRRCHSCGDLLRAADEDLGGRFDATQMRRLIVVGLMCTLQDRCKRPAITQVIHYLHPEATIPDVPADTPPLLSPSVLSVRPRAPSHLVSFEPHITSSVYQFGR